MKKHTVAILLLRRKQTTHHKSPTMLISYTWAPHVPFDVRLYRDCIVVIDDGSTLGSPHHPLCGGGEVDFTLDELV